MRITKKIGIDDLGIEFELLVQKIGEAATLSLGCDAMVEEARSLCPVDTGALASSIRAERRGPFRTALVAGGGGFINPRTGREVDYARLVHDGTSRMPARPFLLQAVLAERTGFASEIVENTAEGT